MLRASSLLVMIAALGMPAQPAASAEALPRHKVIIDQDAFGPGGSNLQPILMLLQAPDIEVLGITVESGDGWQKENVAHTLRMLVVCFVNNSTYRACQKRPAKAQRAGNGHSLVKRCNAGRALLAGSLRAHPCGVICGVAPAWNRTTIPAQPRLAADPAGVRCRDCYLRSRPLACNSALAMP